MCNSVKPRMVDGNEHSAASGATRKGSGNIDKTPSQASGASRRQLEKLVTLGGASPNCQRQRKLKLRLTCSCLPLARAVDERRRAEAGQDLDQQYSAAMGLDDLVANDLGAAIVPALDQYARLDLGDQLDRRVFLEDDDEIDRLQRRQYFGAGARRGRRCCARRWRPRRC